MTATDVVVTNDVNALEQLTPSAQEASVTLYLVAARDKLARAVEMTGPAAVAAIKAEIETAADATKHLRLSREIQNDAAEMVRRAEYALGKAIRVGQDAGEIRRSGEHATQYDRWSGASHDMASSTKPSPTDYAPKGELSGPNNNGIYAMVDNAPEENQFEKALTAAKNEGNLSRANVVRKIRGDDAPKGDRPGVLHRTRRLDSNRIVAGTVEGAVVPTSVLEHVDYSALDRDRLGEWTDSLFESIKALTALRKRLEAEAKKEPIQ